MMHHKGAKLQAVSEKKRRAGKLSKSLSLKRSAHLFSLADRSIIR
jgi:hypothetical protein